VTKHMFTTYRLITAAGLVACLSLIPLRLEAAVGCTLTNPAQDLKYLFPEMTTYREELRELNRMKDGRALYDALQQRLGSDLDPVYETYETPYTLYTIFKGKEVIGIVHGVNVPGQGGLIQVFVSVDPATGAIRQAFFQRLESVAARALRNKDFLAQFKGLTLADFYGHDFFRVAGPGSGKDRIAQIQSPVTEEKGRKDYQASLRGLRKNLILLDIFVYDRRSEPVYQRMQEALQKLQKGKG
jgi:hypothetical protein